MWPLRHSYTNRTLGDGATVVKCYQEPGALARSRLEQGMLRALHGQVPVPQILDYRDGCLAMTFMNGIHGQELLDAGRADGVLRACGTMLWRIHQLGTGGIAALATAGDGQVLVHADYGSTLTAGLSRPGRLARRPCSAGAGHCWTSATSDSQENPGKRNGRTGSP